MLMMFDNMSGAEMDISDSRKRPLDGDTENGLSKRSNQDNDSLLTHAETTFNKYEDSPDNIHLKILVPSVAAGAIIGKGGESIAQIQRNTGARVKMSKATDFYPGTSERICLIVGPIHAVRKVQIFMMEKIRDKPDPSMTPDDAKNQHDRHRQSKVLVPNSTAGMIIGKGGNFIKQIKEESGAYVQISQKSKETSLPERCVTIAGDLPSNLRAFDMVLNKIMEDPQSGSCPNISYADFSGPVASANPTGSPFANAFSSSRSNNSMGNNYAFGGLGGFPLNSSGFNFGGTNLGHNIPSNSGNGPITGSALENLKITLRASGFNDHATEEIAMSLNTLASYGILNQLSSLLGMGSHAPGLGNMGSFGVHGLQNLQGIATQSSGGFLNSGNNSKSAPGLFGSGGSATTGFGGSGSSGATSNLFGGGSSSGMVPGDGYGGGALMNESMSNPAGANFAAAQSSHFGQGNDRSGHMPPAINVNQNSFSVSSSIYNTTDDKGNGTPKQDIEVPESIIGAILGPGGKGVVEIQQFTGTNIQISKKGVYAPGTRNRVVSITGPVPNITRANYMIQQCVQQEEFKRSRQVSQR